MAVSGRQGVIGVAAPIEWVARTPLTPSVSDPTPLKPTRTPRKAPRPALDRHSVYGDLLSNCYLSTTPSLPPASPSGGRHLSSPHAPSLCKLPSSSLSQ
ncbi:hypothetical protein HYPSUDRAFT_87637 [Hypholoma sublateritium FD-334 SS-4]|uniref:Uncharacterized protein n=1 Tax=Hypholoma sublateritium (strain FD-334 SS-4) TaxID=945553 RepID=A0A0D2MEI4_HYPSF|nr:hypothetical protein HYPSUDRAFT_87637 [Hypholoma sublateritium FD-334 SS-4]